MARLVAVGVVAFCLGAGWAHSCAAAGAQSRDEVVALIHEAADRHGLSPAGRQRALRIAFCESRYLANAYNRSSGATGVFQFVPRTAAWVGINPWDAEANIDAAVRLMAAGQWQHWRACW
jgi:hypothetical protein